MSGEIVQTVRVAVIDDHELFRQGLRELLQGHGFEVVAEAGDARDGYVVVARQNPDVALIDIQLPGVNGFTAAREIRRRMPDVKVILLSGHNDPSYPREAVSAGASGYVLKSQPFDAVATAIWTVQRGGHYLPAGLPAPEPESANPLETLSTREREVFDLLLRGFSNQNVARELCISVKTVETHRARIHRKLGVHSVAELVRFGALHGLIRH